MSTIVLGGVSIPVPSAALVLTLTRLYYVVATTVALLGSYSGLFRSTVALYGKLLSNPSGTSSPMRHKKRSPSTAKSSIRLSQAFTTGTMPGYESSGASGRESSRSRSNSRSFSTRPTSAALGIDKPFLSLVALSEEPGKLEHAAHLLPENISREIQKGVDTIAELRVPKRWFTHFYAVGTLWFTWTLLELFVLLVWRKAFGPLMSIVMSTADSTGTCLPPNDTVSKLSGYFCGKIPALPLTESPLEATICTTLMLAQMLRRLAEELFLLNPSKGAQMHVGHYLLGLSFYGVTGVACWIEAAPALKKYATDPSISLRPSTTSIATYIFTTGLFAYASVEQNRCHAYLASLRRNVAPASPQPRRISVSEQTLNFTPSDNLVLPTGEFTGIPLRPRTDSTGNVTETEGGPHPLGMTPSRRRGSVSVVGAPPTYPLPTASWFSLVDSPHYFFEIVAYLCLPLTSRSATLWLCWVWVVANLGVTAENTHKWYKKRYKDIYPEGRGKMIPYVW